MKKFLFLLALLPSFAHADFYRTIHNPFTGTQDYVHNLSSTSIGSFMDVSTTGATNGNCFVYNGTKWTPASCGGGGGGSGGYAVQPATVTFQLNKGFSASTGTFTSLSPGVMHIVAGSSNVAVGLVSLSTEVTGSLPAASIAAGSLGGSVIASSIAASGVTAGTYGTATQVSSVTINGDGRITSAANVTISLTNSNLQSGTYSNVTVPAANVAAGSLGGSVLTSSLTATGITAGSYTNTNLTVDAQGRLSTASNGTFGNLSGSTAAVTMIFDGGGSAIVAGSTSSITIPYACTISSWTVLDPRESGSITIAVKKATYAAFPTLTDMVGAGNAPSLSSAQKNTAGPASWTSTTFNAGDTVSFVPSGITSTTWVNVVLWLIRT